MHLVGPEGFDHRPDLCEQYQRRLDIHGLGITALELLCSVATSSGEESEDWQEWSECSASCGPSGRRKRIRDAESEIEGGRPCNESYEDIEVCGLAGCPRNCIWGEWGGWSNCTKSCGKGD
eukprot:Skav231841  [mRNA]  locus=scaffold2215:180832:191540:+ [translate_table: standard]